MQQRSDRYNPVDVYVGGRLRLRRTLNGLSQERLGHAVGLTFQQIQKYEKGANRISASRMYEFGRVLGVAPAWFFDGIDDFMAGRSGLSEQPEPFAEPEEKNVAVSREALELLRAYARIRDGAVRRSIFALVKAAAESQPHP